MGETKEEDERSKARGSCEWIEEIVDPVLEDKYEMNKWKVWYWLCSA